MNEENGGLFIFFNSSNPDDICKVVKPLSNSAIGFAISEKSNHAIAVSLTKSSDDDIPRITR